MKPSPLQFGQQGPLMHFLHANGYPPQAYRTYLSHLSTRYRVIASYLRPFWPDSDPEEIDDWFPFRDDLLDFLERGLPVGDGGEAARSKGEKVLAMGHSIGATVSLMAALKAPEYFRALVLIEPVIFPPWINLAFRALSLMGLMDQVHPLVRRTLKRRREFENERAMFDRYRPKRVFQGLTDDVLWDYVRGLTRPLPDGRVELAYPPAWEAKIYRTGGVHDHHIWREIEGCDLPVLLIRGEKTDTLRLQAARMMQQRMSQLHFCNLSGTGHLAPLEAPARVYKHVQEFLQKLE